jgi:hypothetical protein
MISTYKEYWKIYEEIGDDIYSFLQMYRMIKSEGMDVQHVNRLLKTINLDRYFTK